MGGAYGHIYNIWENYDLTFNDLANIINLMCYEGKNFKVIEKVDGQNILLTYVDKEFRFARSKSHLKGNSLNINELYEKFNHIPHIQTVFGLAAKDLISAFTVLDHELLNKIFDSGRSFISFEILHPDTTNVIPYNMYKLILHHDGILSYDVDGNLIDSNSIMIDEVFSKIRPIQETFVIERQNTFNISPMHKLYTKRVYYLLTLNNIMHEQYLLSDATIRTYLKQNFKFVIETHPHAEWESSLIIDQFINRWVDGDKTTRITSLTKELQSISFIDYILMIEKNYKEYIKKFLYGLKALFLELGSDIISKIDKFMIKDVDRAIDNIELELRIAIDSLKKSKNINDLYLLKRELKLLDKLKISAAEGILFEYLGNTYKLTGAFAPINQILAVNKFK